MCNEGKIFFKIISGIHSYINLQVYKSFFDKEKNITYSNIELMKKTFLNYKDRINNFFFLHSLLMNAFFKLDKFLSKYDFYTGYEKDDLKTKEILIEFINKKEMSDFYRKGFENSLQMKNFSRFDRLNELKLRFRNISEINNCVSCQKCRVHGKLQIYGVATMFKILFSEENDINLKRNELVSFFNLIGKVSDSIKFVNDNLDYLKLEYNKEQSYLISYTSLIIILSFLTLLYFLKNMKV